MRQRTQRAQSAVEYDLFGFVMIQRLPPFLLLPLLLLMAVPTGAAVRFRFEPARLSDQGPTSGALALRFTGATGHVLDDGSTTILLDPVVTRPRIWELGLGPIVPDEHLAAEVFPKADYILVNHAHFDHAADTPSIALRTGAVVVGSRSVCQLARSRGVPESQLREVVGGEAFDLGSFRVEVVPARHAPVMGVPEPMHGEIPANAGALWFWEYKEDLTFSFYLRSGSSAVWFHPTSTWSPGELLGRPAQTLILGITGDPITEAKLAAMQAELPGLEVLVTTHHDNFFQPRSEGTALMPGLDEPTLRADVAKVMPGVTLVMPNLDQELRLP